MGHNMSAKIVGEGICAVCLKFYGVETPAEYHHVRRLSTSKKRDRSPGFFLCAEHHRGALGIHNGRKSWEERYGDELSYIVDNG